MYQGWAEPGIPPRNIVTYYGNVRKQTKNAGDSRASVHGAGDGALRRGRRHEHVRHGGALWTGGWRQARRRTSIPASRVRNGDDGSDAAAVRLSEVSLVVQRNGQHRRRRQFRVPRSQARSSGSGSDDVHSWRVNATLSIAVSPGRTVISVSVASGSRPFNLDDVPSRPRVARRAARRSRGLPTVLRRSCTLASPGCTRSEILP